MEPTTPVTDVAPSLDDRLADAFGLQDDPAPAEPPQELPEGELAPEETQDDTVETAPEGDWLELDRKGEVRKVSKEEAKRLAQQGLDYNVKMESFNTERQAFEQAKAAWSAKAQITPQIVDAAANFKAVQARLDQFQGLDWARWESEDPLAASAGYRQFSMLKDEAQNAFGRLQQAQNASVQIDQHLDAAHLQQQQQRLYELAPDLRDPQKMRSEQGRIVQFLQELGADQSSYNIVNTDATAFAIVRDALRYRQAVKARGEQQTRVSPSARPGQAPQRATADGHKAETVKQLHQAKDPARRKALLDSALALKFGLK